MREIDNKIMIQTNAELQDYVERVSLHYFNRPFLHQATFNGRLQTTGGRYFPKTHQLDFNKKVIDELGMHVFLGVVKHELCHYHLHLQCLGYKHIDADFKQLLKAVNGLRYVPEMPKTKRHLYVCKVCGTKIKRTRKINTRRYRCMCGGQLTYFHSEAVQTNTEK